MESKGETKVLLFGLGAIGGFYAFILGRNPNISLSVVARSNYDSVRANGLQIESQNHGKHSVNISAVYASPSDAVGQTFDYIVCTHKAINPSATPSLFQPITSSTTTFVIIQNGVGNETPFRSLFPSNTILSCVTWVGASQPTPGQITHTKSEDMQIGLFPNPALPPHLEQSRLETFATLLQRGGTVFQVVPNIQLQRWSKVVWNCAWNPLTTLTLVDTQTWLASSASATPSTRRLMREVISIAQACGVPLEESLVDELMEKILAMPGIGSSMQNDAKAGRALEVDVILGYPMVKARELGVEAPVLEMVFALTMAVNGRLVGSKL